MSLLTVHIFAASAWVGVLGCETVMELRMRSAEERRFVARAHKWIDILLEGPLVAAVLGTGSILLARAWPPSPLLMVKVAAALIGVLANAICIPYVQARARTEDAGQAIQLTRKIALTGAAIPFVLVALVVGLLGV